MRPLLFLLAAISVSAQPLKVGIVGLVHQHAAGFLSGSSLVPAGAMAHRTDVDLVGVVEPDTEVFNKYAKAYRWPDSIRFRTVEEMAARAHPEAVLVFTSTAGHVAVVKRCVELKIPVMMEKPLATTYAGALEIAEAARRGHVPVMVDYETTWYGSNKALHDAGTPVKAVFRDGHNGPVAIHVWPEFLKWLTDPQANGGGALYDFGCYGADLMTWFMRGETPESVTAVTRHFHPDVYPRVDDEADVILAYPHAVAILQGSWDWPASVKSAEFYGKTTYLIGDESKTIRTENGEQQAAPPPAPYDDPLHYLAAVVRGEIKDDDGPSSLSTNVTVAQILDAARESARTGHTVRLRKNPG